MVKQFTIPCQFGSETSPVTLYIGHPETTHHPVHFQSEWLSSVKGGTIPQDLMDTLQKLLDLANENGADFEELCYYALISATQHSAGGVSPEDINKYADEFVKKEGNVDVPKDDGKANSTNNDTAKPESASNGNTQNTQSDEEKQFGSSTTMTEEQQKQAENDLNDLGKMPSSVKDAEPVQDVVSEDDVLNDTNSAKKDNEDNNGGGNADNGTNDNNGDQGGVVAVYSSEDEDLLLADDFS